MMVVVEENYQFCDYVDGCQGKVYCLVIFFLYVVVGDWCDN